MCHEMASQPPCHRVCLNILYSEQSDNRHSEPVILYRFVGIVSAHRNCWYGNNTFTYDTRKK